MEMKVEFSGNNCQKPGAKRVLGFPFVSHTSNPAIPYDELGLQNGGEFIIV
jgi:hypothetical protein